MSSFMPLGTAADTDGEASPRTVSFLLQARAEPGVMPRVVELFAKRGLVPDKWHSAAAGSAMTIDVEMSGLGRDLGDYIARCMRQIVGVETVLTSETWLTSETRPTTTRPCR
jgi:acetolactate synthase small subunit